MLDALLLFLIIILLSTVFSGISPLLISSFYSQMFPVLTFVAADTYFLNVGITTVDKCGHVVW